MATINQALTDLESVGLIRLAQTQPELEFIFRHALVQDAAYESLLIADRQRLHLKIGETIERLFPENRDELASVLAHHFAVAGDMKRAINYLFVAGDRARRLYANEEAIRYFQQALNLFQDLPLDETSDTWRTELTTQCCEGLGDVYELIGHHDEARQAYKDAVAEVPLLEPVWRARLHRKTAYTYMLQRQDESALYAYQQAETTLGHEPSEFSAPWWQEWVQIQLEWMEMYYWQAQPRQMAALTKKVRPAIEQYGTPAQQTTFFGKLVQTNFRRERYTVSDETVGLLKAMWTAAQEMDDLGQRYSAQFVLGFGHLWLGDFEQAGKHLNAALTAATQIGDTTHQTRCLTYLAILSRKCDRIEQTGHYTARALAMASTLQMSEYIATANANLTWLAWRDENLPEVQKYGQMALDLWPDTYPFQWTALWPLIATSLVQNQRSDAVDYTRALLAPTQQRLPDALTMELEKALLKWHEDQAEETRIHLAQAVKLAQDLSYL